MSSTGRILFCDLKDFARIIVSVQFSHRVDCLSVASYVERSMLTRLFETWYMISIAYCLFFDDTATWRRSSMQFPLFK